MSAFFGACIALILIMPSTLEAKNDAKKIAGLLETYNAQNQRVAMMGPGNENQGSIFLFSTNGALTHQFGSYGAGSEKGQSLFGLHDRGGSLRYLFRLYGQNDSPTLVMKDKAGMDKLVIGLQGADETPYIQFIDSKGQRRDLITP